MKSGSFHEQRFDSIQALRGISALFIILEHIRFLNCGAFGVDIFFAISGFMIMFSTHKNTKHFLRKRLIRILPLYYLMTIGTFGLLLLFPSMFEQSTANPVYLIKSLLFIPFHIGNGIIQPLMRIGWTINCEIFFYLLFAVSMRISHRYRGLICSGFLATLVLLAKTLPYFIPVPLPAPLQFYGDYIMLEFVLGIISYYVAWSLYNLYENERIPQVVSPICLTLAIGIFTVLVFTKPTINILSFRRFFLWGIPAMILVLSVFLAGLWMKMPKWSVFLGNMSFSIYLIHYYPVMLLDRKVFDFSTYTPITLLGVLLSIVICLLLAWISFCLIEQKLSKYLLHLMVDNSNHV